MQLIKIQEELVRKLTIKVKTNQIVAYYLFTGCRFFTKSQSDNDFRIKQVSIIDIYGKMKSEILYFLTT